MTQPVRIGMIGCGSVSSKYLRLAEQLRWRGQAEVVVACDVDEMKRAVMWDTYGIGRFTTDYEEVIQADDVDLVLILTSMREHGPMACAALEAGKHVLVEKPMAINLEEAARLVETARHSPGYLLPAPHVVLSPTYQRMWQHIHQGDIGQVTLARARYGWAGPWWGQWFYRSGGGPLFDLGVYNVTSLTGWLGPVKRVTAMTGIAIPERVVDDELIRVETEDNFQILLDFGDNCFAVVTTGFTMQKYRSPAVELYGRTGTIQMLGDDWRPEGYELWQNNVGAWQVFEETDRAWPWPDGLRHMVECIHQQTRPIVTPEHAYHVTEVMIRALEAGRDGQTRPIESTFTPPTFWKEGEGTAAHLVHDD